MSSLWHWLSKERWFPWWWKQRIKTSSHTSFLFIFGKGVLRVLSGWSARSERKRDSKEERENVWFRPGHMMIQTWEKSIVSALSQQRTPTIQLSCQPRLSRKLQEEPLNVLHLPPSFAIVIFFFSLTLLLIFLLADIWFLWIHCSYQEICTYKKFHYTWNNLYSRQVRFTNCDWFRNISFASCLSFASEGQTDYHHLHWPMQQDAPEPKQFPLWYWWHGKWK